MGESTVIEQPASEGNPAEQKDSTNGKKMCASVGSGNQEVSSSFWGRVSFQVRLIWTLYSMGVYVNKIYEDCNTVVVFYNQNDIYYAIVTGLGLILPTLAYTVFVVADHLNQRKALPDIREARSGAVHGMLLIPWQIKSRADQLHFISQKSCQFRAPTTDEEGELKSLENRATVLEFFEEFIAGFIQLILQFYIILLFINTKKGAYMLTTQVVASGLSLFSMIMAIRRRDDGILTGFLSAVGWVCMFVSRAFTIALGASVIHAWVILFCLGHALVITVWVTKIALDSYKQADKGTNTVFPVKKKLSTFVLVFTLFGFPSLTYWPMMFQMKQNSRPLIFIAIMILENAGLFCAWYFLGPSSKDYLVRYSVLAGLCIVGGLFIAFYNCVKPPSTDKVVQHDMKGQSGASFGLYFDFCNATFHLPEDERFNLLLQEVRQNPSSA